MLHGVANLLTLGYCEVLHDFIAVKDTATLLLGHVIELGETIHHALLSFRRELVEAGLVSEGFLLLVEWEIAVALHPLGEVFLILLRGNTGSWSNRCELRGSGLRCHERYRQGAE